MVENDTDTDVLSININFDLCLKDERAYLIGNNTCDLSCRLDETKHIDCLLGTATFWLYVLFMCLGTIGFNVANCVSDATCFDMLGELSSVTEKTPLTQTTDNTHTFGEGKTKTKLIFCSCFVGSRMMLSVVCALMLRFGKVIYLCSN